MTTIEKDKETLKNDLQLFNTTLMDFKKRIKSNETITTSYITETEEAFSLLIEKITSFRVLELARGTHVRSIGGGLENGAIALNSPLLWIPGAKTRDFWITDDDLTKIIAEMVTAVKHIESQLSSEQLESVIAGMIMAKNEQFKRRKTILFTLSDPQNLPRLQLSFEARNIDFALKGSNLRDRYNLVFSFSIRPEDLTGSLLQHEPHIVHFSGHGSKSGDLCFEDEKGKHCKVSVNDISDIFDLCKKHIECVVLNACTTAETAAVLSEHVAYAVGMQKEISDEAACAFASGFYEAIGFGKSVEQAYSLGKTRIGLHSRNEIDIPVLYQNGGLVVNPLMKNQRELYGHLQ